MIQKQLAFQSHFSPKQDTYQMFQGTDKVKKIFVFMLWAVVAFNPEDPAIQKKN